MTSHIKSRGRGRPRYTQIQRPNRGGQECPHYTCSPIPLADVHEARCRLCRLSSSAKTWPMNSAPASARWFWSPARRANSRPSRDGSRSTTGFRVVGIFNSGLLRLLTCRWAFTRYRMRNGDCSGWATSSR